VYERSAVKMTCRQGDGTSIFKENEMFNVVDAQDRTQARVEKGVILILNGKKIKMNNRVTVVKIHISME